jgi:hypothetical protein
MQTKCKNYEIYQDVMVLCVEAVVNSWEGVTLVHQRISEEVSES